VRDEFFFRRLGRTAAAVCALMAVIALAVSGVRAAVGVLGGGLLIAISYVSLAGGTAVLSDVASGSVRVDRARASRAAAVRIIGRYALLGLLAYVMIARLRLHPVGLLAGASSVVAAACIEAVRLLTKKSS
jgi:hypothetical protein